MQSPLWYQRRSAVFAVIYVIGFLGGWLASGARAYVPAFAGNTWLLALAAWCTLACIAVRAWGSSYLTAATVWNAAAKTDVLIVGGPFRFTRNPLYFGNLLLAIGLGLLAPLPGAIWIVVASAAFILVLIRHEEALLLRRYGDGFLAYRRAVPVLLPRLWPAPSNAALRASPAQGVLAETFTACLAAGVFAWVLVPHYGVFLFIALYAAGVILQQRIERRS